VENTEQQGSSSSNAAVELGNSSGSTSSSVRDKRASNVFLVPQTQTTSNQSRPSLTIESDSTSTGHSDSGHGHSSASAPRIHKRKSNEDEIKEKRLLDLSEVVSKLADTRAKIRAPDAAEYFGSFVAERMRMLKTSNRVLLERQITNLLTDYFIKEQEEENVVSYVVEEVTESTAEGT
jgi:hypothetical protein